MFRKMNQIFGPASLASWLIPSSNLLKLFLKRLATLMRCASYSSLLAHVSLGLRMVGFTPLTSVGYLRPKIGSSAVGACSSVPS